MFLISNIKKEFNSLIYRLKIYIFFALYTKYLFQETSNNPKYAKRIDETCILYFECFQAYCLNIAK